MKTIKLPIQNNIDITDIQKIFSSAVRYSYNRLIDCCSEKEIRALTKDKFDIGSWLQQCAIKQAVAIKESQKQLDLKKIIFGSKNLFKKRSNNKISSEQWKQARLMDIVSQGEKAQKGNRLFTLDIVNNNQIIFKFNKNRHIAVELPKLRKNIKKELYQLEELAKNKKLPFQISLNCNHIFITFDESIVHKKLHIERNEYRVLGIDLNPSYIGYSILHFNKDNSFKVLHKEVIDLTELNKQITNKKDFELYEITSRIATIANHYNVSKIVLEELTIQSKDHSKGTTFNKLINNDWNRNIIINSLNKHCNINNINYIEVNPAYSSTVGNLLYGDSSTPDMVASSIEIARRGYKKYQKGWFYPAIELLKSTTNQWKEELCSRFSSWIEVHHEIKNSKMKYRVQLSSCIANAVFRLRSIKSYINCYSFI